MIREMTQLCERFDGINLAQGFTDDPPPDRLREQAVDAIRGGPNHYSFTWGMRRLRDALSEKLRTFNGIDADPETDITITCGATEAIAGSIFATTNPKDEVIILEPFYENYIPNVLLADGIPTIVSLVGDFELPEEQLKHAIGSRTRTIILNTPQNPNGKVYSEEELAVIADLCVDFDLLAIVDETYEYFTFDGLRHVSLASLQGMSERTLTVGTFSKTFSVTGWRVGYVTGPASLSSGVRKVHDYLTVAAPTPLQLAIASALVDDDAPDRDLPLQHEARRRTLGSALDDCGFRFRIPQGAYYILADFSQLSDQDDLSFSRELLRTVGIATVPGSSFYADQAVGSRKVRFAFCKSEKVLRECARRLRSAYPTEGRSRSSTSRWET
jgi:aminotransferase